jgi:hypothetical protein
VRQRVVQICAEEVAKCNAALGRGDRPIEAWAGVTAHTREETLANLDFAIAHGADAAVLAPLSIEGVADPVRFVARDVADLLDARSVASRCTSTTTPTSRSTRACRTSARAR